MARYVVKLPDIGEGMTEAEIVAWHVAPGQVIREEDPLVEIMTDKATVELPSPFAGTVVAIAGEVGEKRPVGSELVVLDVAGEGNAATTARPHASVPRGSSPRASANVAPGPPSPAMQERENKPLSRMAGDGARAQTVRVGEGIRPAPSPPFSGRPGAKPLASPAVRRRAWDLGIELKFVPGTGPGGRITRDDLDRYLAGSTAPTMAPTGTGPGRLDGVEAVPIVGLRRAIAEHLEQSSRRIPHFSYIEEVDVTALEELRAQLNAAYPERGHLTLLPFVMRAIGEAATAHPQVNARYDDDAGVLNRHEGVHIGVATQTERGLLVPVVRHAEALDLWQAAAEISRLADAARAGKASRDELSGSTITVTSLGRLGGLASTPVINYPEVAIIGINRIIERPIVRPGVDGRQIAIAKMMNLSSSFDHRIVDGWEAASFIERIKQLIEQPAMLFIA